MIKKMSEITIKEIDGGDCSHGDGDGHVSSDNEEDDYTSIDSCTPSELNMLFKGVYKISDEKSHDFTKAYILHMCNDDSFNRIAVGLSNRELKVLDINTNKTTFTTTCNNIYLKNDSQRAICVSGVKFLDKTGDTLLAAATDGMVRLFDLRAGAKQQSLYHIEIEKFKIIPKSFICFDRNANSRMLCVGTEEKDSFAYIIFFDVRNRRVLGAYYESHSCDVSSLRFHPDNPDILISGSTDGLINIYDLQKASEKLALCTTINTNSSVEKLNWHRNVYAQDVISCLTPTDVKIYEHIDGNNLIDLDRDQLAKAMKRTTFYDLNMVNTHNTADGGVFLLAGINSFNGNVLRSLKLENRQALPLANFLGNRQIVRDSLYNEKHNILATGGESAVVTLWSPETKQETPTTSSTLKMKSNLKSQTRIKSQPY